MATKVYKYGLMPPVTMASEVREQMRLAHVYRNQLVEIERARRAAYRAIIAKAGDVPALEAAYQQADDRVMALVAAAKAINAKARSKVLVSDDAKAALRDAKAARKSARVALRDARRAARTPEVVAQLDLVNSAEVARVKAARAACRVYWGSYLLVEAAHDQVKKAPMYSGAEPNDPKFQRWTREGAVGVQCHGGVSVLDGKLASNFYLAFHLRPAPAGADPQSRRSAKRQHLMLDFRLDSTDKGRPVFASFPVVLHRPLPDGMIKAAKVKLYRVGPREVWELHVTIDGVATRRAHCPDFVPGSEVGIDIGWRTTEAGLKVAAWQGSDCRHGFLHLSSDMLGALSKADSLRSIRDRSFDESRAALQTFLRSAVVPDWMTERTKTLGKWRAIAKLAALARFWAKSRFDGDETVFVAMEKWRYHDFHLWAWESSQRRKALLARREVYRIFAADLAQRYETVKLERFVLSKNPVAASNRTVASHSEFRGVIKNAFLSRGGNVDEVDATYTSQICNACGHQNDIDGATTTHVCVACGVVFDRDANAAANILSRPALAKAPPRSPRVRKRRLAASSEVVAETRHPLAEPGRPTIPEPKVAEAIGPEPYALDPAA